VRHQDADYVKLRMARARETLVEAEMLLGGGHLRGAVNRIYYACFYAVNALLFCEGLSSSKHGGVISLFDRHWIKTGRLPLEMGKLYRQFFELRQEGDYQDAVTFEAVQVREWLSQARSFVDQVADWLRHDSGTEA
jgi:uncharacterized protein (UPF0332 family)